MASCQSRAKTAEKILFEGSCDRVRQINNSTYFIINAFSSVLLSASNHGMQCLSAPKREEIDKAHSKRIWLDGGVLSQKHLRRIDPKRVFRWFLLGTSSLPLHLFYVVTARFWIKSIRVTDLMAATIPQYVHPSIL
jgi:hypothetical protein